MKVAFRVFSSFRKPWEQFFGDAAAFASEVGRDRLFGISHSENHGKGVVTVWYWE